MKALLGLLLLSVLLTSGYSLECEKCVGQGTECTGKKVTCPPGQDSCLSVLVERTVGSAKETTRMKSCFPKDACKIILNADNSAGFGDVEALMKAVQCSKAPVSSGSFFLALSALLFLKLLW